MYAKAEINFEIRCEEAGHRHQQKVAHPVIKEVSQSREISNRLCCNFKSLAMEDLNVNSFKREEKKKEYDV